MFAVQVSGTGHAGMEATIANCLEPGETIVVATSGIWGQRVCDLSERYGGKHSTVNTNKTNVGLAYLHGNAGKPAGSDSEGDTHFTTSARWFDDKHSSRGCAFWDYQIGSGRPTNILVAEHTVQAQ